MPIDVKAKNYLPETPHLAASGTLAYKPSDLVDRPIHRLRWVAVRDLAFNPAICRQIDLTGPVLGAALRQHSRRLLHDPPFPRTHPRRPRRHHHSNGFLVSVRLRSRRSNGKTGLGGPRRVGRHPVPAPKPWRPSWTQSGKRQSSSATISTSRLRKPAAIERTSTEFRWLNSTGTRARARDTSISARPPCRVCRFWDAGRYTFDRTIGNRTQSSTNKTGEQTGERTESNGQRS